jgi:hypothetical protein
MLKNVAVALSAVVLILSVSTTAFAQKDPKDARVEGKVVFSNKDKSMLGVRTVGGAGEGSQRIVYYDDSTKWVSQYHGVKKENAIDASQVKDGDYIICLGSEDEKGKFRARMISKRLSHSPK